MRKIISLTILFLLVFSTIAQARTNGEPPRPTTAQPKPWISQDAGD